MFTGLFCNVVGIVKGFLSFASNLLTNGTEKGLVGQENSAFQGHLKGTFPISSVALCSP